MCVFYAIIITNLITGGDLTSLYALFALLGMLLPLTNIPQTTR